MDPRVRKAIETGFENEPFVRTIGLRLTELRDGYSAVEMVHEPARHDNLFRRAHGGAIYALIDEAFEIAAQSDGSIAVALNVNVTYVASPEPGSLLRAEAKRISQSKKTANFDIWVMADDGKLIATCRALAFRTGKPLQIEE
ncbi:MAG: thioesterase [Desulfuromonas sp.]|nr:MAG: thioesterase [Desulfuromonas sp.]